MEYTQTHTQLYIYLYIGNGLGDMNSIPGHDCISHSTNTLGKSMNPIILPPPMGK